MNLVGFLAFGLLAWSCQDATRPSPTPPRPDVLMITPAIDGLKLGFMERLTATLVAGDGTRRTVPAVWSSDASNVASVSDEGFVRGLSLGKATVRASFEALSALQAVQVVPDYEGTWSGRFRITGCTRLSGRGPDICPDILVGGGAIVRLKTVVTQAGATVTGTIEFSDIAGTEEFAGGPMEGRIDDFGALALTATIRSPHPEHPSETTVNGWSTTLTDDGNQMAGRFTLNRSYQNFWGPQQIKQECLILTLERARP